MSPAQVYLAVRGHDTPAAFEAAYRSGADAVVFDLDKPVPVEHKALARQQVAAFLARPQPLPTWVRLNGPDTADTEADLEAVVGPGLTGLRLTRVEDADWVRHVARVADRLCAARGLSRALALEVFPGTCTGLRRLDTLATATHTVQRLGLAEESLYLALGSSSDAALALARAQVVQASHAAGLPGPVQKSFVPHWPLDELHAATLLGASLGFTARTVWRADHVAPVRAAHAAFRATPLRVADGRRPEAR